MSIGKIIEHIETTQYQHLPHSAVRSAKAFILDSVGVGISGSCVEATDRLKQSLQHWGNAPQAQVWATGEWLPANAAAMVNGFQIHNQEWDCVHEKAVVHPMAVILSALVSYAQREKLSGKQLILGVVIAVDIATLIGGSATSGLKFFRPALCGCLGAVAGIAAMLGLKGDTLTNALGIAYSQLSGTMQAHVEGSSMLPLQIGINAANAINSVDMAIAGMQGPEDILDGQFGYFSLFEDSHDPTFIDVHLGQQFQIERVSHKPFPTGRAGHATIDGLQSLKAKHQFDVEDVESIEISAPPLIHRLVSRPAKQQMSASYAKLCNGYIAATALLTGSVNVEDFTKNALNDESRLLLAKKVSTSVNQITNPNALSPVTIAVQLTNNQRFSITIEHTLGHPDKPLSRNEQLAKFRSACQYAKQPFSTEQIDNLIISIDRFEAIENINDLVSIMVNTEPKA